MALNFNDAPVYPVAAPAVRLDVAPVSFLDFKTAVFAPDEGAENNFHGTDFSINGADGALVAFEASYLVNQSPNDRGLIGTYKLGTFVQQGDYASFGSQAANALDPRKPLHKGTNVVGYGVADQELFKNGQYTVEAFARVGFGTPNYSFVHDYFDTGLNFIGFVPNRQLDVAGIAVGRSDISRQYSKSQVAQGQPGYLARNRNRGDLPLPDRALGHHPAGFSILRQSQRPARFQEYVCVRDSHGDHLLEGV